VSGYIQSAQYQNVFFSDVWEQLFCEFVNDQYHIYIIFMHLTLLLGLPQAA
jgi:hypothetical protein